MQKGKHPAPRTGWRAELRWLLASTLLTMLLLSFGFGLAWPLAIDVGARDLRFVERFNAPEHFVSGTFRWSTDRSTLFIPHPPTGLPVLLSLRLLDGRPDGHPMPQVSLSIQGRLLGSFSAVHHQKERRLFRMIIPPHQALQWDLPLDLRSDTLVLPNDPRKLGIAVDAVELLPLGGPFLPSAWLLMCGFVIGLLGYLLLRSVAIGPRTSFGVVLLLAVLLACAIAARPIELLPFLQRVGALIGVGCLGVWIVRLLAPIRYDDARGQLVHGVDLPIYLAVAWWMAPIFQFLLLVDGAQGIGLDPRTLWFGGVVLVLLLTAYLGVWVYGRRVGLERPRSLFTRCALVILAAAAVVHAGYLVWLGFQRGASDFWILFRSVRTWAQTGELYDLAAVQANHVAHVFKVPPFYGMLFTPFVFQDGLTVLFFHRVMNTVLLATACLIWIRMWNLRWCSSGTAGILVLLSFWPLTSTLTIGQIDLVLLVIMLLVLWSLRCEHDLLAGGLIALGTLFKIYPLLLLGFLIAKRRWYGLAGFVLGMLVLNGIAIVAMGWEVHRVYLFEVFPRIGGTTSWMENQTISGFLARLVDIPVEPTVFSNPSITMLGNALSAALILFCCFLSLRSVQWHSTEYTLQYSLFMLLMVLAVPVAWMHYEALLFIPYAALLLHLQDREISLARALVLGLSFGLLGYGSHWSFYNGAVTGILTLLGFSYKFYGMLLLGGIMVHTLLEQRAILAARSARIATADMLSPSSLATREGAGG